MNERILEEAERLFEAAQTKPTVSEYEREQQAILSNFARLKAERLEREAIKKSN
jgi:hypothetical protein